ncbi:MAG: sugar transferase [Clostridia bacterium]|nr:sugar transferase [Clostridia bacterium]
MIRKNQQVLNSIQKIIDLVILFISIVAAYYIRFYKTDLEHLELSFYMSSAVIIMPLYLWTCSICNLYKPFRTNNLIYEFLRILEATVIIAVIALALSNLLKIVNVSRLVILYSMIVNVVLLTAFRFSLRIFLRKIRSSGHNIKYILLIGKNDGLVQIAQKLSSKDEYGYVVTNYKGSIGNLNKYLRNNLVDEIFVATEDNDDLEAIYGLCEKFGIKINIIPAYGKFLFKRIYVDEFIGIPIINVREIPLESIVNRANKRIFDILISIISIIVLLPLSLIVAILIKATSKGPVIYKQRRVSYNRRLFYMYKFRSMKVDESFKGNVKADEDERCTKVGKFIRKYKIDEIPQLFNVLKGDMSLVGPRPEIPTLVKQYQDEIPNYMLKHQVKAGMTGLAQVNGYMGDTSIKKRIEFDNKYINEWSMWLDIKILFLTLPSIFKKSDVTED